MDFSALSPDFSKALMASLGTALLIGAVLYVYIAAMLMIIARKTGTPNAWLAWVPIVNILLMCKIARISPIWALTALIPLVNIIALAIIWMGIARSCGKPGWLGLLLLVPGVNLIIPAYLAFATPAAQATPQSAQAAAAAAGMGVVAGSTAGPAVCPACGSPECVGEIFCGYTGQRIAPAAVAGSPLSAAAPAVCPACGSPECVGETFCAYTGQRIAPAAGAGAPLSTAAPAVSAPTAAPPRKAAKIAVVAALLVAAAFLAIGAVTAGGRFLYRAPQQQPPQMPQRMAGTLNEFPVDTAPVATRPTAVVSQSFKGNEAARQVKTTQKSLPPGISTAVLPKIANSVTSATYKSRPEDPPVNVHVLDTRTSGQAQLDELAKDIQVAAGADAAITGVRAQSPSGAQYGGYRVRTPTSDAYVLAKAGADILVMIFSPESAGRETAARLAANLGNGAGLMDDPEVRGMVCALPAMLPAGLELDQVSTANLSQMPEQIAGSLAQFGAEGQKWAEQIRRFVPQRLTTSVYRGPDNQRIEVLVGDYGGATSAWTSWTMLRWILRPWSSTNVDVHGTSGLNINAEGKRFVLFQRGPFLVVLQGDAASAGNNLLPLANSLQI